MFKRFRNETKTESVKIGQKIKVTSGNGSVETAAIPKPSAPMPSAPRPVQPIQQYNAAPDTTIKERTGIRRGLKKITSISINRQKFSAQDQIIFFQNFASMSAAGLSMVSTLEVLSEQTANPKIRKALDSIMFDVQNGQRLAYAMRKFPKLFAPFLIENIHVGETAGQLTEIMERIVLDLEKTNELRKKIVSAIAYPLIVVIVMIFVVIGLVTYVLPKITDLYHELGAKLPLTTRWLIGFYNFLRNYPYILPGVVLLAFVGYYFIRKSENGLYRMHYAMLKLPVFGQLIKEYNLARFFRTTDTLFKSGMSLLQSVEISKRSLSNRAFTRALDHVHPVLVNGGNLSSALQPYPFLFPLQAQRMLEVGERTGKYQEAFKHLTSYYERSVSHKTQIMNTLIEPILMVTIGIIVGGLALTIFLPIYNLANVF